MNQLATTKLERGQIEAKFYLQEERNLQLDYEINKIYKEVRNTDWGACKRHAKTLEIVINLKKLTINGF